MLLTLTDLLQAIPGFLPGLLADKISSTYTDLLGLPHDDQFTTWATYRYGTSISHLVGGDVLYSDKFMPLNDDKPNSGLRRYTLRSVDAACRLSYYQTLDVIAENYRRAYRTPIPFYDNTVVVTDVQERSVVPDFGWDNRLWNYVADYVEKRSEDPNSYWTTELLEDFAYQASTTQTLINTQ